MKLSQQPIVTIQREHDVRPALLLQLSVSTDSRLNHKSVGLSPLSAASTTLALSTASSVKETSELVKFEDDTKGCKFVNSYCIIREIGRGVHGKVKLAQHVDTSELVAIKVVRKILRQRRLGIGNMQGYSESSSANKSTANPQLEKIRGEIAIMKKCIHPNVVRLIEVIDDPNSEKVYMVLEHVDGGEIQWKDAREQPILSLETCRHVLRSVIVGLEYCMLSPFYSYSRQSSRLGSLVHAQGIIHRDIKPANLLWTLDQQVKLSDFGVSYFSRRQRQQAQQEFAVRKSTSNIRTLGHSAPNNEAPLPRNSPEEFKQATDCSFSSFSKRKKVWRWPTKKEVTSSAMLVDTSALSTQESNIDRSSANTSEDDIELAKTAGSPAFFAPELCLAEIDGMLEPTRPNITKSIDIWALGVTLYCFVFGRCPFLAETEYELFDLIPAMPVEFPSERSIDTGLQDLLLRLLEKDPRKRITLEEAKRHTWTLHGLADAQHWLNETDPALYEHVQVTEEDVKDAVSSVFDKLKRHIRRLSLSFQSLTFMSKLKRKTQSMPSVTKDDVPRPSTAPSELTGANTIVIPGPSTRNARRRTKSAQPGGLRELNRNINTTANNTVEQYTSNGKTITPFNCTEGSRGTNIDSQNDAVTLCLSQSFRSTEIEELSEDISVEDWDPMKAEHARHSTWSSEYVDSDEESAHHGQVQCGTGSCCSIGFGTVVYNQLTSCMDLDTHIEAIEIPIRATEGDSNALAPRHLSRSALACIGESIAEEDTQNVGEDTSTTKQ